MEENKNNQQQQNQFQMGISPEVAEGTYSNLALITHSSSDFILDFACALPGMPAPQIKSRVIMAPEHAKRLLQALQSNVYNYEQTFGKIKMAEEQQDRWRLKLLHLRLAQSMSPWHLSEAVLRTCHHGL